MKKTTLIIVLALLCLFCSTKAQLPTIVSGYVTSPEGTPLEHANIQVTGSTISTTTNGKGFFSFNPPTTSGSFTISYTGYKPVTQQYQSSGKMTFQIQLQPKDNGLKEVEINAGYYSVKERERTGSISKVTAKTIEKQPLSNPLLALQGAAPGIFIQQTSGNAGSNVNVTIRGKNSIAAGNNPFYVIDGVPFISQTLSTSLSSNLIFGSGGSSPLNILNPRDIASIEILKDADATAIYGSRGSNGVILITTKKGQSGKTTITLNQQTGLSTVASKLQVMNTPQYLEMRNEGFKNDGISPSANDYDLNGTWDKNRNTDWQKELIGGTALFNNSQLSISGGNAHTQLLLSGNYQYQSNVYPGDYSYRKYSVNFSGTHTALNDRLKATFSLIYGADKNDQFYSDLTSRAVSLAPNAPALYTADGKLNWENSTWVNPLREMESQFLAKNNTLSGNLSASFQILKNLSIKANIGYNDNRLADHSFIPSSYYDPAQKITSSNSLADFNNNQISSWIAEAQLNYQTSIGKGKLSFMAGMTFQSQQKEQLVLRATGFTNDALIGNPKAASNISIRDFQEVQYNYQAVYGRINYSLKDHYFINLTGRRDGSSRFGPGKQFANFGAIGLAWLFSDEDFISKNIPALSFGKLRISYGITGNDQIGDYEFLDVYSSTSPYNNVNGLEPTRLFNPDLAWEVNTKFETGLDLSFFNDRINLSLAYYLNRSSNQLISYTLAATTGFTDIRSNLGATVQNTGLEIDLSVNNIQNKNFKWTSAFNLSIPKNKLISFPGLESSSYSSQYVIGQSLDLRRLYKSKGVNPQTGLWEVVDVNGDGKITAADDKQILVNRTQHFYGGLRNTFSYNNFELGLLLQFVSQTKGNYYTYALLAPGKNNHSTTVLDNRWQSPGDQADIQQFSPGSSTPARTAYSQYVASDAVTKKSYFIRLKNIDCSYTIKTAKGLHIRLYAQGQNLFKLTNYFGLDPELDGLVLPPLKTITIGTQFTF